MKQLIAIVLLAVSLVACSKSSEGGSGRLKNDTDSVAYILGMNIGWNLMQMDSTLNTAALCEGIRDVFRQKSRLTAQEAEDYYLRHMNFILPEKAKAYEEQFLADLAKSNRSFARTRSGVTYSVEELGDQERIPASERDSIAIRLRVRSLDDVELYSSYERGDTLHMTLGDLTAGGIESLKLIGEGGRITAWIPSALGYGGEGSSEYNIAPNNTICFEFELVSLDKFAEWNRRKNSR